MALPTDYIYADNAATTPLSQRAFAAMEPYLTSDFGNPGGIHRIARQAADDLKALRGRMAELLGARAPQEIYFTSGGSESNNWILRGFVEQVRRDAAQGGAEPSIITSTIEHHAILNTCKALESQARMAYIPVDAMGHVDAHAFEEALNSFTDAALASIMLANNEVGTLQDVKTYAEIAHSHGALFHTDAVQAVGHIPVDVQKLGVDALSLSAHKFHGPRGVGVLYLKEGTTLPPLIAGGGQERSMRAGTENLAGIAGMVAALEESLENLDAKQRRVAHMRDELIHAVCSNVEDVRLTGDATDRLPSIASFVCKDVDAELLIVLLDKAGVAAATGSACSSGSTEPSHVVQALGITDPHWSKGSLRISLGDDTTPEQLSTLKRILPATIKRARLLSGI